MRAQSILYSHAQIMPSNGCGEYSNHLRGPMPPVRPSHLSIFVPHYEYPHPGPESYNQEVIKQVILSECQGFRRNFFRHQCRHRVPKDMAGSTLADVGCRVIATGKPAQMATP